VCAGYKSIGSCGINPSLVRDYVGFAGIINRRNLLKKLPKRRFDFVAPRPRLLFGSCCK
jgi:hypothetical protein